MSSQTNAFRIGLVEQAILNSDFTGQVPTWKTIDNGMCRLPEAAAKLFGEEKITLQASVQSIEHERRRVRVGYVKSGTMHYEVFDAVLLAIPASAVHMIPEKPQWPVQLRHGLRAIHYLPLYKIGMQFKSRFWENCPRPSKGGQSTTDLPCRWVVYPSYGIGERGKGVLLMYSWMTDSNHWLPKSDEEKIAMGLKYLKELYPNVDIHNEYTGKSFAIEWATNGPAGVANFYEGQFTHLYPIMLKPQGNIYFAGDHLSVNHAWIVGALDSAKRAVEQICHRELDYLKPGKQ